ncbi:MAG: polysaccharide pyruvyl transferase family protein [Candidatus Zipacnadales bacterium]
MAPLSKRILWPVIRDSVVTACREEMTLRYLLSAGAPADKLVCLPDTAFALEPAGPARARHLLAAAGVPAGTPTMGLTVRPWYFIGSPDRVKSQRQYLVAVAKTVDHLFRKYGVVSILVRQNFSAYPSVLPLMEDDTSVYPDLLELVTEPGAALVLEGDYTVPELISLYGEMDLVLTTRLHAGIMASLSGTPSVAIAYNPYKTRGIMHMLGLNEWVLDIDNLQADDLIKLVEKAWESRFVLRDTIREAMPRIKGALAQYAELTAKGLMTTGGR